MSKIDRAEPHPLEESALLTQITHLNERYQEMERQRRELERRCERLKAEMYCMSVTLIGLRDRLHVCRKAAKVEAE
jgi:predicted RNase H-like nuclease (RuvC/YqgF family)